MYVVFTNFQSIEDESMYVTFRNLNTHSVEKREKIFRQINSLVTYLVKPLLSRNFWQKCVREKSSNFHSTLCAVLFLAKIP